jgi:hypothetical protein
LVRDYDHVADDIVKLLVEESKTYKKYENFRPLNCLTLHLTGCGFSGWVSTEFKSGVYQDGKFQSLYGLDKNLMYPSGYDSYDGDHDENFYNYLKNNPDYKRVLDKRSENDPFDGGSDWLYDRRNIEYMGEKISSREVYLAISISKFAEYLECLAGALINHLGFSKIKKSLPFYFRLETYGRFKQSNSSPTIGYDAFRDYDLQKIIKILDADELENNPHKQRFLKSSELDSFTPEDLYNFLKSHINDKKKVNLKNELVQLMNKDRTLFDQFLGEAEGILQDVEKRDYDDFFCKDRVPELIFHLEILVRIDQDHYQDDISTFLAKCLNISAPSFESEYIDQINKVMDRAMPFLSLTLGPHFKAVEHVLDIQHLQAMSVNRLNASFSHPLIKALQLELIDSEELNYKFINNRYYYQEEPYLKTSTSEYEGVVLELTEILIQRMKAKLFNGIELDIVEPRLLLLGGKGSSLLTEIKSLS